MVKKIEKEAIASVLVLLPYLENNFTQKYFQWYFSDSYIRAATIVSFGIVTLVLFYTIIRSKHTYLIDIPEATVVFKIFMSYAFIVSIIQSNSLSLTFCSWIWLATPVIFSSIVINYYLQPTFSLSKIAKYSILWFAAYLSVVLVYYIFRHRLFIDSTIRMSPRGGGAVIFGYTIALFFAFTLIYKNQFGKRIYYLLLAIFTIGAFGTTTRGSVWLVVLLWIANFAFDRVSRSRLVLAIMAVPAILLVGMIDFSSIETTTFVGFGRLLNIHSFRRVASSVSILDIFGNLPIFQKLFGFGLGNFFPYQKWAIFTNDIDNNMFNYEGYSILVQPHNSFLYILMECGIIGIIVVAIGFIFCIIKCFSVKNNRTIYRLILVASVILLNCLDSVFFVQPGASYLFWLLLFITVIDNHSKQDFLEASK